MSLAQILSTGTVGAQAGAMSQDDGVNTLLAMDDEPVRKAVGSVFTMQMQTNPAIGPTFFPSKQGPAVALPGSLSGWCGNVAAALVGWSLSHTSQHGFAPTANGDAAKNIVQQQLAPGVPEFMTASRANYDALFANNCGTDKVKFSAFTGPDAAQWGRQLADRLTSAAFTVKQMGWFQSEPDRFWRTLYLYIYMVGALSPPDQSRVVQYWDKQLEGKGAKPPWDFYEHMLAGNYNEQTFLAEVVTAISAAAVTATTTKILGCHGGPAASCSTTEVPSQYTYGIGVANWLNGRNDAWRTGSRPNNVESASSGGCCFVAGTPILMADGTSKPIEEVAPREAIFGRDGVVVHRSRQDVVWDMEDGELLFGINDLEPFFNASHPLLTKEGWKAMSPASAKRINPHLEIGRLQEGDVLFQVSDLSPFQYREVRIDRLTWTVPGAGAKVYSIHLHRENYGYHAHGFCVAVNYPEITEDSFTKAFSRLTSAERRMIRERMAPIMPLIRRGMGNFVQQALDRSLNDPVVAGQAGAASPRAGNGLEEAPASQP
jgi:hypothetical protein